MAAHRSGALRLVLLSALLGPALLAGGATAAQAAQEFRFSYTGNGVTGSGTLEAVPLGGGAWLAVAGTDTTSGGPISGTLTLFANPYAPNNAISPSGYFLYDNQFFPDNTDRIVDYGGLLFVNGTGGEVNLFTWGPDSYVHYDNTGYNVAITFDPEAVPEPATLGVLGAGLLGLTMARRRRAA